MYMYIYIYIYNIIYIYMCYSYTGSQNDQQMNRYLASDPLVPHLCRFSGGSSHLKSSCHSCLGGYDSSPKGMIHKPDTQWNLDIQLYRYTVYTYIFKKSRQTQAGLTTSHSNNLGPLGLRICVQQKMFAPEIGWFSGHQQHICSSMPWHTAQLLAGSRRMSKELRRGLIYLSLIENTLNGQHETSSFGCCRNAVSKHVMLCCPLLAKSWNYMGMGQNPGT